MQMEDISKEFKVFRDPTFNEFISIVGTKYNQDLPLFAQLYILKEILQFYQLNQNQTFLSLCLLNISFNMAYFYFNYKLLFKRATPFFSLPRIFLIFVVTQLLHEQVILKHVTMNNYRVNINDLFDQDEDFLFENDHFKALVRKIRNDFEYLVNPIFDLEDIVKSAKPEIDQKYKKDANGWDIKMNQGELINLFS